MGLFTQRRTNFVAPILAGFGGLLVGAGIVSLVTPRTGPQLRGLLSELLARTTKHEELAPDLDRMEGEGGVSHAVVPPNAGSRIQSHS